jgi:hypothetical protein
VKFAGLNICLATARVPQLNTTFTPVKASLEERTATGRPGNYLAGEFFNVYSDAFYDVTTP